MSKIIIIGSSAAGHTAAVSIRNKNKDCAITLITEDVYPGYDKRKLPAYLAGMIKEKELFLAPAEYYASQNINFLKGRKVYGINTSRRLVYFKEDETRKKEGYDFLIICSGRKTPLPDIPGINKEGVIRFDFLSDFKQARKFLLSTDTVCFWGWNTWAGQIAKVITEQQKEIKVIVSPQPSGFAELPHVEVINSQITEIIGESGVQAVKLKEGKIIGAAMVAVFTDFPKSSIDFLKDTDIEIADDTVCVDETLRTNLKNVFACGAVAGVKGAENKIKNWDDLVNDSVRLADNLIQAIGG